MPFNIHSQSMIFMFTLAGALRQMDMYDTLSQGPFDIKLESHMLGAPLVCLGSRSYVAITCPARP